MSEAPARKKRKFELDPKLASYKGVWVFVEHERGQVHPVSWELMGEGRKLADMLGVELVGVVLGAPGEPTRRFCTEAIYHSADLCYLMEDDILKDYRNEPFTKGMTNLVNTYQPEILLLGATTQGRDLAGSVATTLQTGLTADCTALTIDPDNRSMAATRPTFGGSLLCTIVTLNYRPQMATVRPRVMAMAERDASRTGRVIEHPLGMVESSIITKVLEYIPDAMQDKPQLAFADIIVAGGRGMKKPENFQLIWDLAQVLGAKWVPRAPWCRPAGSIWSGRWGSRARPCGPSSTSPPASPARSSTGSGWMPRIASLRSTTTPMHRSSTSPPTASSATP